MKERPILFSGPMVRAILDGRKTQTRRVVKCELTGPEAYVLGVHQGVWGIHESVEENAAVWRGNCPFGIIGDRLWVRETWKTGKCFDKDSPAKIAASATEAGYRFDSDHPAAPVWYVADGRHNRWGDNDESDFLGIGKTRVSIHMPRWASRITLEITDVRIERLNEISEEDAYAEGVIIPNHMKFASNGSPELRNEARVMFQQLWESINGDGSWYANPFVWVIEFKRVKP